MRSPKEISDEYDRVLMTEADSPSRRSRLLKLENEYKIADRLLHEREVLQKHLDMHRELMNANGFTPRIAHMGLKEVERQNWRSSKPEAQGLPPPAQPDICRCDSFNLFAFGHDKGCPEARG